MPLAEFIVAFRETFEIALVIGIMLAYLHKTKNSKHSGALYLGIALAVIASVLAAAAINLAAEWFEENEALFEGTVLVISAVLVTWLVLWMLEQKDIIGRIKKGLRVKIGRNEKAGLVAFAFVAVFREGAEMVLFLWGIWASTGAISVAGAIAGGAVALLAAYAFFTSALKLPLGKFFTYTSIVLVLLAAGLLSQGVHELQEAKVLPTAIEHVYDITPSPNADGSFPLMHEKGAIGGVLKGLVGYDTSPSLEQAAAYFIYLGSALLLYRRISDR
ncbi:TPA: hypothetical protein HA225_01355 [Candidatus Micrarchaeota archaeon]|nr:hypothetical protein [Candidatus Micrarchaeota archaeon]HIH30917.1 hypothetical protein [Candidatus Micrarchaeota archaeon]